MPAASITLKPAHMPVAPVSAHRLTNCGSLASSLSAALSSSAALIRASLAQVRTPGGRVTAITSAGEAAGRAWPRCRPAGCALEGGVLFGRDFEAALMSMDMSDISPPEIG